MSVAHVVEILGNLYFHVVGNAFVLLYACEEFGKGCLILGHEEVSNHAEHAVDAFAE